MEFDAGIPMSRAAAAVAVTEGTSLSPSSLNEGLSCMCMRYNSWFLFAFLLPLFPIMQFCGAGCVSDSFAHETALHWLLEVMVNCRFCPFPRLHSGWISVETSSFFLNFGFQKWKKIKKIYINCYFNFFFVFVFLSLCSLCLLLILFSCFSIELLLLVICFSFCCLIWLHRDIQFMV